MKDLYLSSLETSPFQSVFLTVCVKLMTFNCFYPFCSASEFIWNVLATAKLVVSL